jgi:predicted LPLAT superfamily acyltransferase
MCGFRAYPLKAVAALLAVEPVGRKMDFDTDILVRLFWRGVPVVMEPIKVSYPAGNSSNFDVVADNWRITRMHSRLVSSLPLRLPGILRARPPALEPATHWARLAERGMYGAVRLSAAAVRLFGRRGSLAVLAPVVLFFYLTGGDQRRASRAFLTRASSASRRMDRPGWLAGYRHFLTFTARTIDTFAAWAGALPPDVVRADDPTALRRITEDPRGAVFVVSHLGNSDIARALLDKATRDRLIVLVHTRHAENFNRVLARFNPEAVVQTLQVTELGPGTAMALRERIERGQWVAIAGDRVPVSSMGRVATVEFLGRPARLPEGPVVLAAVLGCPVYLLFCLRDGGTYRLHVERFAERIELPRATRDAAIKENVERYARRLESHVLEDPYQWYNFFDFWAQ